MSPLKAQDIGRVKTEDVGVKDIKPTMRIEKTRSITRNL